MAVELSRHGEARIESGDLADALRSDLEEAEPNHPIFIPARTYTKANRTITVHLMEGYVFVASGLPDVSYFRLEHTSKLVSSVMSTRSKSGMRVLSTIREDEIEDMRRALREKISSDIELGTPVRVLEGAYSGLEGEVIYKHSEHVGVYVELRSAHFIASVPMVSLETIDMEPDKPVSRKRKKYQPKSKATWSEALPEPYVDHLLGGLTEDGRTLLAKLFVARSEYRRALEEQTDRSEVDPQTDASAMELHLSGDPPWPATTLSTQ